MSIKKSLLFILLSLGSGALTAGNAHWGYSGHGDPSHWANLAPDFATCGSGKSQSPIDIQDVKISTDTPPIKFNYKLTRLNVVNNGHTIQVNVEKGSSITVGAKTYQLLQFHFHSPSEHTIGGKPQDMVAHLVHKADDGQLAVIAVLMNKGADNPIVQKVWLNLPKGQQAKKTDVTINVKDLLPANMAYFNYTGSLTTPPCSEGVNWMVLVNPVQVGGAQIATFTKMFPASVRPVQPGNGRATTLAIH